MRILITAGPTREFLDPVRFLSNASSGKIGVSLAAAADSIDDVIKQIIAKAAAVNSVPDMRAHLDAARESGATPEQIRAAIAIAGKVKTTAEREFAAAMGYQPASPEREVAAEEPKSCGCR